MKINELMEVIEDMGYKQQAEEFLKATETELKIVFMKKGKNPLWGDKENRNIYQCLLINTKHDYAFKFYDSISNYKNNKKPTKYDILACLQGYEIGTFKDFCNDFGYDIREEKNDGDTLKIYNACKDEYNNLIQLFTEEEIDCLSMIN